MRNHCQIYMIALLLTVMACQPSSQKQPSDKDQNIIKPDHAIGFSISKNKITIQEPWPGAKQPQVFTRSDIPQRIVVTGTPHLPYLEMLELGDKLVGFPGTQYIYSPYFRKRVEEGLIRDLGPDGSLNLEILFELEPDLVIAFDMGSESSQLDKIKQAGIPILYNSDYLETSVLGRAEWIKVFGALFNKQRQADSIFQQISDRYLSLQDQIKKIDDKPTVFSGIMYGETWFLPGGQNGAAQLMQDAGGRYLWDQSKANGWLELSFESVFDRAHEADYWMGVGTVNTLKGLKSLDARYASFRAFQQKHVFNYSKRISPGGGYDYFESGYARPDLILADLVAILHPELLPNHSFVYFEALD